MGKKLSEGCIDITDEVLARPFPAPNGLFLRLCRQKMWETQFWDRFYRPDKKAMKHAFGGLDAAKEAARALRREMIKGYVVILSHLRRHHP